MPALGHLGSLQAVKESTWGTNPASGYTAQAITNESLDVKIDYQTIKAIRASRVPRRKVALARRAGGSVTWEADVEGILGQMLLGVLPSEATVDNGSGNGGVHTFTPGNTVPSFSFLIDRDTTPSATNIWAFTGSKVTKLSLEAQEGATLKAVADLSCKDGAASATASSPSFTTENPLIYHTGTFTVDGSAVAIKGFKLDLVGNLKDNRGKIGTNLIQEQQAGLYAVSGEIEAYFDDMTLVNKYLSGADAKIILDLTGSAVGTATRGLTITIPTLQFQGETPKMSGPENETMLKLPFFAYQSGSGTPDALISIALTNSKRTAY